jgi:hypothetical protein
MEVTISQYHNLFFHQIENRETQELIPRKR